jgi:hypothetical protein
MKPEKSTQAAAATTDVEGEIGDLVRGEGLSRYVETGPELGGDDFAPLIQKIGDTSIAEFEKLIGELQQARADLQSEGERIQRETVRYAQLSQTASETVKIISETVSAWRKAGHPVRNTNGGPTGPAPWLLLSASRDPEA